MDLNPPPGSSISIASDGIDSTIVVPATSSASRYLPGLFLLFWLGGWAVGFRDVGSQVLAGNANAFLVFWLCGWTVGGVLAVVSLYRIFRPAVPETLKLKRNSVAYDAGIQPPQFNLFSRNKGARSAWSNTFYKRVRVEIDRRQLQSLRLRETESGNRLTIDVDAQRLEIAAAASEVEREWLAGYLARRYSLRPATGAASEESA
jgi:hypothetical protein